MARGEKRIRVRITGGVIFEGRDLLPGETHVLPDWFAQPLIQSNRGVDADEGQDGEQDREHGGGAQPAETPAATSPRQPARPRG